MADGVRLRQLVHNLIKNSLETIDSEGWIKIQTRCLREHSMQYIELVVEDSGDGIADEISDNLFEHPSITQVLVRLSQKKYEQRFLRQSQLLLLLLN